MKSQLKRLFAAVLTACMLLTMLPANLMAATAGAGASRYGNSYDQRIIDEMASLCGEEYDSIAVLDDLFASGFVDETGHMKSSATFDLDGETVELEQLKVLAAAARDPEEVITLDGQAMTWGQLQETLSTADAVSIVYEAMQNPVAWDAQRKEALASLAKYIQDGGDLTGTPYMAINARGLTANDIGGALKDFMDVAESESGTFFSGAVSGTSGGKTLTLYGEREGPMSITIGPNIWTGQDGDVWTTTFDIDMALLRSATGSGDDSWTYDWKLSTDDPTITIHGAHVGSSTSYALSGTSTLKEMKNSDFKIRITRNTPYTSMFSMATLTLTAREGAAPMCLQNTGASGGVASRESTFILLLDWNDYAIDWGAGIDRRQHKTDPTNGVQVSEEVTPKQSVGFSHGATISDDSSGFSDAWKVKERWDIQVKPRPDVVGTPVITDAPYDELYPYGGGYTKYFTVHNREKPTTADSIYYGNLPSGVWTTAKTLVTSQIPEAEMNSTWYVTHRPGEVFDASYITTDWRMIAYNSVDMADTISVKSITIPSGTFEENDKVQLLVNFSRPVLVDENLKLKVNGVELTPMTESKYEYGAQGRSKIHGNYLASVPFEYTVKAVDSGTIAVESLAIGKANQLLTAGVSAKMNTPVAVNTTSIETAIAAAKNNNCRLLVSKTKLLEQANVKVSRLTDDKGQAYFSIRAEFSTNPSKELRDLIYPDAKETQDGRKYLGSMYYTPGQESYVRYPIYIETDPGNESVLKALVCDYYPPETLFSNGYRTDRLVLAVEETYDGVTDYFATREVDGQLTYTDTIGKKYTKESGAASATHRFYSHTSTFSGINTYDISLYYYVEAPVELTEENVSLVYQEDNWPQNMSLGKMETDALPEISYTLTGLESGRRYYNRLKNFSWVSSDDTVATVLEVEDVDSAGLPVRKAFLVPTGKEGTVRLQLQVLNGDTYTGSSLTIDGPEVGLRAGDDPFLMIYPAIQNRVGMKDEAMDIPFTSNLTARNDATSSGAATEFTLELYPCDLLGTVAEGTPPLETYTVQSTAAQTLGKITIPQGMLSNAHPQGYSYAAVVKGTSLAYGTQFEATAKIKVVSPPVEVVFDRLESYGMTMDSPLTISWSLKNLNMLSQDREATLTIRNGSTGEAVVNALDVSDSATGSHSLSGLSTGGKFKETFLVSLTARNGPEDDWSSDSCVVTVYTNDFMQVALGGESLKDGSYTLSNFDWLKDAADSAGVINYGDDINAFRSTIHLSEPVKLDQGSNSFGALSDQIAWGTFLKLTDKSSFSNTILYYIKAENGAFVRDTTVTRDNFDQKRDGLYIQSGGAAGLNYKRGGFYSDIYTYNYISYDPNTEFMLVGNGNGDTVLRATHARTGAATNVDVSVKTMADRLYMFSVLPKGTADVQYVNGKGDTVTLKTDAQGQLVLLEPEGIASDVLFKAVIDGTIYLGVLTQVGLLSGERDATRSLAYPVNVCRLGEISEVTLYVTKEDGSPYVGNLTLRGGVYKNGFYCYNTAFGSTKGQDSSYPAGILDHSVTTDSSGKATLYFAANSFIIEDIDNRSQLMAGDQLQYIFELQAEGFYPAIAVSGTNAVANGKTGAQFNRVDARLEKLVDAGIPYVYDQTYTYEVKDKTMVKDIRRAADKIGPSNQFDRGVIQSQIIFPNVKTVAEPDEQARIQGYAHSLKGFYKVEGDTKIDAQIVGVDGTTAPGQTSMADKDYSVIVMLSQLSDAAGYCYPFSTYALGKTSMSLDADTLMNADKTGWLETDEVRNVKMRTFTGGVQAAEKSLSYQLTNLIGREDPQQSGDLKHVGAHVADNISEEMDVGEMFSGIDAGAMLETGMQFFSGVASGGALNVSMLVAPTIDPTTYKIVLTVTNGDMDDDDGEESNVSTDFTDEDSMKAIQEMLKDEDDDDDDDDDDDEPGNGDVQFTFNFKGAATALARYSVNSQGELVWDIIMTGGSFDAKAGVKVEWKFQFFCGPIPIFVEFGAGMHLKAGVGLQTAITPADTYTEFLTTLGVGASLEAFAGVGMDAGIVAFKLGIFGEVSADIVMKLLASEYLAANGGKGFQTGTRFGLQGEVGLKLEVKLLFITYSKTFASVGFELSKTFGDYDDIVDYWSGVTENGGIFTAFRMSDGSVLYSVDSPLRQDTAYLTASPRAWNESSEDGTTLFQTNANPYASPAVSPDGSVLVYISDVDDQDEIRPCLAYALWENGSYVYKGVVDHGDLPVHEIASISVDQDSSGKYYVAWVAQTDSIRPPEVEYEFVEVEQDGQTVVVKKEKAPEGVQELTESDIAQMFASAEVYFSTLDNGAWTTARITDNTYTDFNARVAAANGRYAIAYREGISSDMARPDVFNVSDRILVRRSQSMDQVITAYNGSKGSPMDISIAMLSTGEIMVVYAVNCGVDGQSGDGSEVFYTLIDKDGNAASPVRLTSNLYTDENAQVAAITVDHKEKFLIAWYGVYEEEPSADPLYRVTVSDVQMVCIDAKGLYDLNMPERVGSSAKVGNNFQLLTNAGGDVESVGFMWHSKAESDGSDTFVDHDVIYAAKLYFKPSEAYPLGVTGAQTVARLKDGRKISTIKGFQADGLFRAVMTVEDYDSLGFDVAKDEHGNDVPIFAAESTSHLAVVDYVPVLSAAVRVGYDKDSVIPGLEVPMTFQVTNTGTATVTEVSIDVGGSSNTFADGVAIDPGSVGSFTVYYPLPADGTIPDPDYAVTAKAGTAAVTEIEKGTGVIVLHKPDLEVANAHLAEEAGGKAYVDMTLCNTTEIPLSGSGKAVHAAVYPTSARTGQPLAEITVAGDDLTRIDNGTYTWRAEIDMAELSAIQTSQAQRDAAQGELPNVNYYIYIGAEILNADDSVQRESSTANNQDALSFGSLLSRAGGDKFSISAGLTSQGVQHTVTAEIVNNSFLDDQIGNIAYTLYDQDGNVLDKKITYDPDDGEDGVNSFISVGKESTIRHTMSFDGSQYAAAPYRATAKATNTRATVTYSYNSLPSRKDETFSESEVKVGSTLTRPATDPADDDYFFRGWYADPQCTREFDFGPIVTEDTTIYAKWVIKLQTKVEDVTVAGERLTPLEPVDLTVNLAGGKLKGLALKDDVTTWLTNLPAGLEAEIKTISAELDSLVITVSGTPTEKKTSGAVAIAIPMGSITPLGEVEGDPASAPHVTNAEAKYAIIGTRLTLDETPQSFDYTGEAKAFALTEKKGYTTEDYTIKYSQGGGEKTPTGAGVYDVTITRDEDALYSAYDKTITGGLIINKVDVGAVTIAAAPDPDQVYDGDVTLTAQVQGITIPTGRVRFLVDGQPYQEAALDAEGKAEAVWTTPDATEHTIQAVYLGDDNFNAGDSLAGSYSIRKGTFVAEADYTAAGKSVTYDGLTHSISVTLRGKALQYNAAITYSTDGELFTPENPALREAGVHTVYYRITQDNYNTVTQSETVRIAPRTAVLTWAGQDTRVYDDSPNRVTATVANLGAGDAAADIAVTVENGGGQDAGDYTARATALSNPSYILDPDACTVDYTILRRPVTVVAEPQEKLRYDREDPPLTFTVAGDVEGSDDVIVTLARAPGGAVGVYPIVIATSNPNYLVAYTGSYLAIKAEEDDETVVTTGDITGTVTGHGSQPVTVTLLYGGRELAVAYSPSFRFEDIAVGDYSLSVVSGSVSTVITVRVTGEGVNMTIPLDAVTTSTKINVTSDALVNILVQGLEDAVTGAAEIELTLNEAEPSGEVSRTLTSLKQVIISFDMTIVADGSGREATDSTFDLIVPIPREGKNRDITVVRQLEDGTVETMPIGAENQNDAGEYVEVDHEAGIITVHTKTAGSYALAFEKLFFTEELEEEDEGAAVVTVDGEKTQLGTVTVTGDETAVTLDQEMLTQLIGSARDNVTVTVPTGTDTAAVHLAVKNIEDMAQNGLTLVIGAGNVELRLPCAAVDTGEILKALGAPASADVSLSITITRQPEAEPALPQGSRLVLPPVSFTILAQYQGQSYEVTTFSRFISRVMEITSGQAGRVATAVVIEPDGALRHVPTRVYSEGEGWFADIKTLTNSVYALVENAKTFDDAQGKWYQEIVNEMGSRMIINGVDDKTFAGDRSITRAEFAAIVVRALGLPAAAADTGFEDVSQDAWYAGAVGAAYRYGIVNGRSETVFDPAAGITRQEAMVMIRRAAALAGLESPGTSLDAFGDAGQVADWALEAARFNVAAGLIQGSGGMLRPKDPISRAECAAVTLRMLRNAGLIDNRSEEE